MRTNKWFVIVNPKAASERCGRDWPEIKKLLDKKFVFDHVLTQYPRHAISLTVEAIEKGYHKIISVGGDGTLNEVVNGIFSSDAGVAHEIILGVFTVGTGNDWGRTHQMPTDYESMVKVIDERNVFMHDVGKAKYRYGSEDESRYFLNIAGMGFDAMVAKRVNTLKQKGHGGVIVYMISLLGSLFKFKNTLITVSSKGKKLFSDETFLVAIGNCRFNGGGMMLLPDAIPDDGLFDMTIISKVSRFKVIANLKKVFDGSFVGLKEVKRFRAESFTIESTPANTLHLETDGESLGLSPLDFSILPKALKIIVPKKELKG